MKRGVGDDKVVVRERCSDESAQFAMLEGLGDIDDIGVLLGLRWRAMRS